MDKRTAALILIIFIDMAGFGIVIPILPLLVERISGGALLVGAILSVFSLMQFVFSPILGRLSDKYGRRPILLLTAAVNAVSYFLIFFSQAIWILFLARIIAGIGSANMSVAQAYIADVTESHERTKKLALLAAAFGLGFIVGPLLGGVVSSTLGIPIAFLITGIISLINTLLIYFVLPESNKNLQKHVKIQLFNLKVTREVLEPPNMSFLLFLFFFVNLSLALIMGVFPIFAHQRFGWNEAQNGYYFALIGMGSFITQAFLINRLLKIFDETQLLRIALLVFGLSIITLGVTQAGIIALIVGPFTSFGFSLINVNTQSLISLESKPEEQGMVLGVAQSFASMARVIGPLLGGIVATINIGLPYIFSGILSIGILVWGFKYLRFMRHDRTAKRVAAETQAE